MEVEKRGVKGGFFHLFDWNAKSRKRLFSSKSVSHENTNQGKENFHGSALARVLQEIDKEFTPNVDKGQNHYQYTSSVAVDSEYGTKPPGVVARLMGLDSLPTSNANESSFNPFIESSPSLREPSYSRYPPTTSQTEEHDIVIFQSVRNKLDGLTKNPLDVRLQKFQTETLPPKSAKPISVTQHRMLSPVKSPRFVPSKNAAYIIEAAAKLMEQSPRANIKGKLPSLGSSYVPLRIHELKEKMESAENTSRKYKEQKSIKNMKKQHNAENHVVQSADGYLYKGVEESKRVGSQRLKSKERSVSPAVQGKSLGVQKREGLISVDNRSSLKQKEYSDTKNNFVNRNRPTGQKTVEKRSSSRKPTEVLRLNNQKQNCASTKETEVFEPLSSHTRDRKGTPGPTNYITGQANRTVNKIVVNSVVTSRKTNVIAADPGKEVSSSRAKITSKKKLPINGNIQSDGILAQNPYVIKNEKGDFEWGKIDNNKNNLDVVSFTFTSPIKKLGAGSSSCGTKMSNRSLFPSCDPSVREYEPSSLAVPSSEFNEIGGDSLSILLETKLKELTSRIELSQQEHFEESSFSCSDNYYGDMHPTISLSNQETQHGSYHPSVNRSRSKFGKDVKGLEPTEEDGKNNFDYQRYNHLQDSSFSVANKFFLSDASHEPLDVDRNLSSDGNTHYSSLVSNEGINWISTKKSHAANGDVEISDTASSFSIPSLYAPDSNDPSCSELQFIEYIMYNADLMFEEFALGLAHKIIPPDFFRQLENQLTESNKFTINGDHKVLFDCVCECLESKCDRLLAGSKTWAKQTTLFHDRRWLAEEVYREVSGWINLEEEMMVDEIVDMDMSRKNGQWVDFKIEAFEEGVEIEDRILGSLVDELVNDFLF